MKNVDDALNTELSRAQELNTMSGQLGPLFRAVMDLQGIIVPLGEWEKTPRLEAKTSVRLLSERGSRIQGVTC